MQAWVVRARTVNFEEDDELPIAEVLNYPIAPLSTPSQPRMTLEEIVVGLRSQGIHNHMHILEEVVVGLRSHGIHNHMQFFGNLGVVIPTDFTFLLRSDVPELSQSLFEMFQLFAIQRTHWQHWRVAFGFRRRDDQL